MTQHERKRLDEIVLHDLVHAALQDKRLLRMSDVVTAQSWQQYINDYHPTWSPA